MTGDDSDNKELLEAILDLRNATELGFNRVDARFGEMDRRFDVMEERWDRRFDALESRVEVGFTAVDQRLRALSAELAHLSRSGP